MATQTTTQTSAQHKTTNTPLQAVQKKPSGHYQDWPNAPGFNAAGDQKDKIELEVVGEIPEYAAGTLYRTGPGSYKVTRADGASEMAASHWFDGFTTVHKFDLVPSNGKVKVSYSSYGQVDELIEIARRTGDYSGVSFGQKRDPCDTFYRKFKTVFAAPTLGENRPHQANIGVALRPITQNEKDAIVKDGAKIEGRRLMTVTTDAASTKHFDADTLEPLGVTDQSTLHPSLTGVLSAAHAEHDPVTGDIYNYNLAFGAKATYRVFKASPKSGKVEVLATVSGSDIKPAYLHSLLMTENFVVLCLWPAYFQHAGIDILWNRNMMDSLAPFDPKNKAVWVVVDRRHGRGVVKKFTSPAFYCFHTINAWEERNEKDGSVDIIADLFAFNNMEIMHNFYYENLVSDSKAVNTFKPRRDTIKAGIARYRLSDIPTTKGYSSVGKAKENVAERIQYVASPDSGDLPRINDRYRLKQHRYVYGVMDRGKSSFMDGLVKTDMTMRTALKWDHPKHTPGEPVFVRNPAGVDEDDGVILSVVLDGTAGTSYLLCLDARTMKEIGRADVGRAVGFGFHGVHLAKGAAL